MALQHEQFASVLGSLCEGSSSDGAAELCASSVVSLSGAASSFAFASEWIIVALVLSKAFFGFVTLSCWPSLFRPFDFLVASGASHCLVLVSTLLVYVTITGTYAASILSSTYSSSSLLAMSSPTFLLEIASCGH